MGFNNVLASILLSTAIMGTTEQFSKIHGPEFTLFNFTNAKNLNNWSEISDTVRRVGMSKAELTLQKTQIFQRAVFFTLLNPQPNGAGFAGVRIPVEWNLSEFHNIEIKCRGQGSNMQYKVVLRHKYLHDNSDAEYEQFFTAPMSNEVFSTISLPLSEFKAYHWGELIPDAEPLDTTFITMFGLQVFGGVYMPIKQSGVSALEIEYIKVKN